MSKKSSSSSATTVQTSTTTNIRDIGLTGQNAADVITVLEAGAVAREKIGSMRMDNILSFADASSRRAFAAAESAGARSADPEGRSTLERLAPFIIGAAAIAATAFVRK